MATISPKVLLDLPHPKETWYFATRSLRIWTTPEGRLFLQTYQHSIKSQ